MGSKSPAKSGQYFKLKLEIQKAIQTKLSTSVPLLTSYPEPCIVCKLHQCQMDKQHQMIYSVSDLFDQVLDRRFGPEKEPPDEL